MSERNKIIDELIEHLQTLKENEPDPIPDPISNPPFGIKKPLEHLLLFFRLDPRVPITGLENAKYFSFGWSTPLEFIARENLNQHKHLKHLAYTVATHSTKYEGHAPRLAQNFSENWYLHLADRIKPPIERNPPSNHARNTIPKSAYLIKGNEKPKWIKLSPNQTIKVEKKNEQLYLGCDFKTAGSFQDPPFDPVFCYEQGLHWNRFIGESEVIIKSSSEEKDSRLGYQGYGNWLMDIGNATYRSWFIQDRLDYLDRTYREHFYQPNRLAGIKQFDGIYIDDGPLDIDYSLSGLNQHSYFEFISSLCRRLDTELKAKFSEDDAFTITNVGNWKWDKLKVYTKHHPYIYLDRVFNRDATLGTVRELKERCYGIWEQSKGVCLVVMDGEGGSYLDNETERNNQLFNFLCAYYLSVPNTTHFALAPCFNGDNGKRSDWERHFHPAFLGDIGHPLEESIFSKKKNVIYRKFSKAIVSLKWGVNGLEGDIKMLTGSLESSITRSI